MTKTVTLELYKHHETASAVLMSDDGERDNAVWLPESQVDVSARGKGPRDDVFEVTMPEWLAKKNGLI